MEFQRKFILNILEQMVGWSENQGYYGYDPYDLRVDKTYAALASMRLVGRGMKWATDNYPVGTRKIFFIKKNQFPKAFGLFLKTYLLLYKENPIEKYLEQAHFCLEKIFSLKIVKSGVSGWGFPLTYQSGKTQYPKNQVPFNVVTAIVVEGLLAYLELENGPLTGKVLDLLMEIYESLTNAQLVVKTKENEWCFRYSPVDDFLIHNANLFTILTICRLEAQLEIKQHFWALEKCLDFTLERQNLNGGWYYGDPKSNPEFNYIDNYHMGFVLRCLKYLQEYFETKSIEKATQHGVRFYLDRLIDNQFGPKFRDNRVFPIDVHGCAEELLVYCTFSPEFPELKNQLINRLKWMLENMWNPKGFFYYRMLKPKTISKIGMIRWGQAWMARALIEVLHSNILK